MKSSTILFFAILLPVIFIGSGCSRKSVWIHFGPGFAEKKVSAQIKTSVKDSTYEYNILKDTLLNNYVTDLTYSAEVHLNKRKENALEIEMTGKKYRYFIFNLDKNYFCDYYQENDSMVFRPLLKNEKFY